MQDNHTFNAGMTTINDTSIISTMAE